jgi:tetratricopeptide (TPR) repeat protein
MAAVAALAVLTGCGGSSFNESKVLSAGLQAQAVGRLADADTDYLAVVKHDARNKLAWYNLGVIQQRNGQSTQAQHDYLQALGVDPKYVPALYNLALIETTPSPMTAVKLYQQVTALQPANAAAHYNLGSLLEKLGEVALGQQQITTGLTLDPALGKT